MVHYSRYFMVSAVAAVGVLYHAFATRQHFYAVALYLSTSKLAVAIMGNLAFATALLLHRAVIKIFLGNLRDIEQEATRERLSSAVMETLLALTIFRDEFSGFFVVMFAALLFLKVFHWLVQDRVDYIEVTPSISRLQHLRIIAFMSVLLAVDTAFLSHTVSATIKSGGQSVMLLFAFEYVIQASDVIRYFVKYAMSMFDLWTEGRWQSKATCVFYLDLITDLLHLFVYVVFFVIVFTNYGMPLHLVRDLYNTFRNFMNRIADFLRFRQVNAGLDRLPNASADDLSRSDGVCIICREEMSAGGSNKKLFCGHVFHMHCLRSWLERQQSCPTCRGPVFNRRQADASRRQPAAAAPAVRHAAPNIANVGAPAQGNLANADAGAGGHVHGDHADPHHARNHPRGILVGAHPRVRLLRHRHAVPGQHRPEDRAGEAAAGGAMGQAAVVGGAGATYAPGNIGGGPGSGVGADGADRGMVSNVMTFTIPASAAANPQLLSSLLMLPPPLGMGVPLAGTSSSVSSLGANINHIIEQQAAAAAAAAAIAAAQAVGIYQPFQAVQSVPGPSTATATATQFPNPAASTMPLGQVISAPASYYPTTTTAQAAGSQQAAAMAGTSAAVTNVAGTYAAAPSQQPMTAAVGSGQAGSTLQQPVGITYNSGQGASVPPPSVFTHQALTAGSSAEAAIFEMLRSLQEGQRYLLERLQAVGDTQMSNALALVANVLQPPAAAGGNAAGGAIPSPAADQQANSSSVQQATGIPPNQGAVVPQQPITYGSVEPIPSHAAHDVGADIVTTEQSTELSEAEQLRRKRLQRFQQS